MMTIDRERMVREISSGLAEGLIRGILSYVVDRDAGNSLNVGNPLPPKPKRAKARRPVDNERFSSSPSPHEIADLLGQGIVSSPEDYEPEPMSDEEIAAMAERITKGVAPGEIDRMADPHERSWTVS